MKKNVYNQKIEKLPSNLFDMNKKDYEKTSAFPEEVSGQIKSLKEVFPDIKVVAKKK